MKSLNGLVFIVLGALAIWIGATGRLPALAAALGMVRAKPATGSGTSSIPSSTAPAAAPTVSNPPIGLTPKGAALLESLNRPQSDVWQEALKSIGWTQ